MAKQAISPETIKRIAAYKKSFELFARDCLRVRDHVSQQILPFIFNRPQRIFHSIVEKQRAEIGYVRIILDKARRFGGSTYIEGRGYWKTSMNFNTNAFIVAHEEDSTDTLFAMARLFHDLNPIKPATKYSSKKELLFDTADGRGLKSQYGLACAKTTSAGRSQGIHFLHVSELAFFPDNADELLDGLMSCISVPEGTEVYLESTGNGYGNRFQRDVFAAYGDGRNVYYEENGIPYAWRAPGSDWVLVFIPWFAHEPYHREFDTPEDREEFGREIDRPVFVRDLMSWEPSEAAKLRDRYGLTLEQLHWRAWKIEDTFRGRVEKFRQEFPATVEESFLSTGSNVYPPELCDMLEAQCATPILVGDLVDRMGKTKIRPNATGHFSMWRRPTHEQEDVYFLTVDSGGGKKERHEREKRDPDPTCIDVWHRYTGEQVAQWHGHIDYDLISDLVEMIGRLYARHIYDEYSGRLAPRLVPAVACVEVMNHGYTVVAGLKAKKYPMYEYKPGEPGWSTNSRTKAQMVDGLYESARDGSLQIRCRETVAEMRTFVEVNGSYNAESGCHDERVDTAGMASQMIRLLPADRTMVGGIPRRIGARKTDVGFVFANQDRQDDGQYKEFYA